MQQVRRARSGPAVTMDLLDLSVHKVLPAQQVPWEPPVRKDPQVPPGLSARRGRWEPREPPGHKDPQVLQGQPVRRGRWVQRGRREQQARKAR